MCDCTWLYFQILSQHNGIDSDKNGFTEVESFLAWGTVGCVIKVQHEAAARLFVIVGNDRAALGNRLPCIAEIWVTCRGHQLGVAVNSWCVPDVRTDCIWQLALIYLTTIVHHLSPLFGHACEGLSDVSSCDMRCGRFVTLKNTHAHTHAHTKAVVSTTWPVLACS